MSRHTVLCGSQNIVLHGKVIVQSDAIIRGDLANVRTGRYCIISKNAIIRPPFKKFSRGLVAISDTPTSQLLHATVVRSVQEKYIPHYYGFANSLYGKKLVLFVLSISKLVVTRLLLSPRCCNGFANSLYGKAGTYLFFQFNNLLVARLFLNLRCCYGFPNSLSKKNLNLFILSVLEFIVIHLFLS